MIDPVCPVTGGKLSRDLRPMTLCYRDRKVTFAMPGWYGDTSQDSVHDADDMKVSDRALNRLKAEADGLLSREDVRRIRRKLGLTQQTAGDLIGGGPRAFQKYEAGDLLPSRALSSALMLLDRDPAALAALTARVASIDGAQKKPAPEGAGSPS